MTKMIKYLLFITHNFLLMLSRINSNDICLRCINTVSIILCNGFFSCFGIIYMFLISRRLVSFNKLFFFTFSIIFCLIVFIFMHRSYLKSYDHIMEELSLTYKYNNKKYILFFLISFFIPILLIGIGLVILRKFLY